MIYSPCRDCPKITQPKDKCARTCKMLQSLQETQVAMEKDTVLSAADYYESELLPVNHARFSTVSELS